MCTVQVYLATYRVQLICKCFSLQCALRLLHTCFSHWMCMHVNPWYSAWHEWFWSGNKHEHDEQLCLLFYTNHHYLVINLIWKFWCTPSYLGYKWQVWQTSSSVHNSPITFDSLIIFILICRHPLFGLPVHVMMLKQGYRVLAVEWSALTVD